MFENLEVVLWGVALATWLMMLFAIVGDVAKKLVGSVRGRLGRQRG